MTTVVPFSDAFISQYHDAFTELVQLGSYSAQRRLDGKSSDKEDDVSNRMLIVLKALSSPGLTDDNIESLEYCLVRLNESLTVPTVDTLLPEDYVLPRYRAELYPAGYHVVMQDVTLTGAYILIMEPAIYTMTMQSFDTQFIDLSIHITLTMEPAIYAMTMQAVTFTFTLGVINPTITFVDGFVFQSFKGWFESPTSTSLTVTGDPTDDTETDIKLYESSSMYCYVVKLSNGGIAMDNGVVLFLRTPFGGSEVLEPGAGPLMGSQSFVMGQLLSSGVIEYTFTGLGVGDSVRIFIQEA